MTPLQEALFWKEVPLLPQPLWASGLQTDWSLWARLSRCPCLYFTQSLLHKRMAHPWWRSAIVLSDLHPSFFPWRHHLRSSFEWLEKDFWLNLANHVFHLSSHVICWKRTNSEYTISKPQHESPQDCWGYKRKEVTQLGKEESKVSAICRRHDCISRKI